MNKYVILVNPETTGLHLTEKIQDSGYLPVAAYTFDRKKWRKYQAEGELICPDEFCVKEMFHAVYFSSRISALIRDLKSLDGLIAGVIPASEPAVNNADIIGKHLGVICNRPETISARRNKVDMKKAVRAAGLRTADYSSCKTTDDLRSFINSNGFPIVLKIPDGQGTYQVHICNDEKDAAMRFHEIMNVKGLFDSHPGFVLAEDYIQGTEYAVNLLGLGAKTIVTDVWKYTKVQTEFGRNVYYSTVLETPPHDGLEDLTAYAIDLCKAVGIQYGPAHAEVKIDSKGPVMMEIAGRLAGTDIPLMASLASNIDILQKTIDVYTNHDVKLPDVIENHRHSGIAYCITCNQGTVKEIQGLDEICRLPSYFNHSMRVQKNETITPTTNLVNLPLVVRLLHSNRQQVLDDIQYIHNNFVVHTGN